MSNLQGKTAVITGGSTGIGFATARILVAGGAKVVVTARSRADLDVAVKELGPSAVAVAADTSKLADIDTLAKRVRETLGHVDFLFVNAGVGRFAALEAVGEADYDQQFAINTKGAYFTVQKLLPLLSKGAGVVVNTSVVDQKGMPSTSVYAATKAALRSFARTLAAELLERNIRVNAVSPGPIETPILGKLGLPKEQAEAFAAQLREANPMKRFGLAEEVARAAIFLGVEATYTTGAELPVDGGLTQL